MNRLLASITAASVMFAVIAWTTPKPHTETVVRYCTKVPKGPARFMPV